MDTEVRITGYASCDARRMRVWGYCWRSTGTDHAVIVIVRERVMARRGILRLHWVEPAGSFSSSIYMCIWNWGGSKTVPYDELTLRW